MKLIALFLIFNLIYLIFMLLDPFKIYKQSKSRQKLRSLNTLIKPPNEEFGHDGGHCIGLIMHTHFQIQ